MSQDPEVLRSTLARRVLKPMTWFCLGIIAFSLLVYAQLFFDWVEEQTSLEASTLQTSLVLSLESVSQLSRMQRIVTAIGAQRSVEAILVVSEDPPQVVLASQHAWRGKPVDALPPGTIGPFAMEALRGERRNLTPHHWYRDAGITESMAVAHLTHSTLEGLRPMKAIVVVRTSNSHIQLLVFKELLVSFGIQMLLMAVTVFFIARIIGRQITQPLTELVDQLRSSPARDFLESGGAEGTEVGLLVEAFNNSVRQLRSQESFQREVLNHAGAAIIAVTEDGVVTLFNPEAQRLLGYTSEEMVGRQSSAIFHDAEEVAARAGSLSEELGETVEPGFEVFVAHARRGRTETREWIYIRKDGSRFPVLLSVSALRDEQGRLTGFLGVARDLSDLKERERVMRDQMELIARRTNLLQEVHHRVKNNLQIVSSLLSLQMRGQKNGELAEQLRIAHARINSISALHELIYDVHDVDSVRLADLVGHLATCLTDIFKDESRKVSIRSEVDDSILVPQAKAGPVALILNELVTNSIKHAFPKARDGEIRISARSCPDDSGAEGKLVVLDVADNGVGNQRNGERSGGLGSMIIERLCSQIRAKVENVPRENGFCTRITVGL